MTCNFADNNTLYNYAQSINEIIENLHYYLKIVLKWSKYNQMMANPGNFQYMF